MIHNAERLAAETILEKGVRVKLPAPFFFRLFFIKTIHFTFRPSRLGTLMKVSKIALKNKLNIFELRDAHFTGVHRAILDHAPTLAQLVAVLWLDRKRRFFLIPIMTKFFLWNLTSRKMAEIVFVCMLYAPLEDFTTSIRLFQALTTRIVGPKNLSHEKKGS